MTLQPRRVYPCAYFIEIAQPTSRRPAVTRTSQASGGRCIRHPPFVQTGGERFHPWSLLSALRSLLWVKFEPALSVLDVSGNEVVPDWRHLACVRPDTGQWIVARRRTRQDRVRVVG